MLLELINNLTKEEVRFLKLFLLRTNANKERKDIKLFDQLRKYDDPDENRIADKLYEGNKNAYYRLKNRLLEDINKSLLTQYYDSGDPSLCYQYLLLSRLFFSRNKFTLSYKYLRRAEKIAEDSSQNEVLDIIYSDYIRLSHETLDVNPEVYIEKRKDLSERLRKIREIDDLLAVLIFRVKKSQNYAKNNDEVLDILQSTINEYSKDETIQNSPVLRFKIYQAVSRILLQQHDYSSLEIYLEETYQTFNDEALFNRANHDTKLQMLTYWTNSLFKNQNYIKSLKIAEDLSSEMNHFDKALRDKYYFFFVNAQIINYSILDSRKALAIAEEALTEKVILNNALHRIFILLNKAQLLFDIGEFRKANKSLIQLKLDDAYDKLDAAFRLKIRVAELIIRFEMEDFDSIEILTKNVQKDFKEMLDLDEYQRQVLILEIIDQLITVHNVSRNTDLLKKINLVLDSVDDREANETDLINYNHWLRPKIKA